MATTLAFARLKTPVAAYLARAGIGAPSGSLPVFVEVDDAVAAFRALEPDSEVRSPGAPGPGNPGTGA
jgi:hypothetical protein